MHPVARFLRFNLVGLLGIAVQLTTLALLNRALPHHYLLTSTLAVELTILHNFAWHARYTWPETSSRNELTPLLRFHLSNGLVSLLGNFALMRLFIHEFHTPILLANTVAIAASGVANFALAHHWAFARTSSAHAGNLSELDATRLPSQPMIVENMPSGFFVHMQNSGGRSFSPSHPATPSGALAGDYQRQLASSSTTSRVQ